MPRRPCRSRELALAAALLVSGVAGVAHAQACCAGAGVFAPARLKLGEDALAGVQLKARSVSGSFAPDGSYLAAPSGTTELDFEQDLLGTVRPFGNLQLGISVPLIETRRTAPGLGETGWGLGDLALNARYELIPPNTSNLPGFAILAGASLPTGRAPEDATSPLATDATGLGSAQLSLGLDVERALGRILVDGSAQVTQRLPRTVGGVHEQLGLAGSAYAAGGYAFRHERALALFVSAALEGRATINGQTVPDSSKLLTTVGLSAGTPLPEELRLQGRLFVDLPVLGRNQTAGPGLAIVALRAW